MNELKLQETGDGELFFRIPDDVLDRLGWEEGDEIKFVEKDGGFLLKKVKYESVELDFDKEDLLNYMTFAHFKNITFNELCEQAIKEKLDGIEKEEG
jgi:bifunctional DNA-binding transcriptional regulator/antitoxin component of YhaV-PrlF toxin-antitoxin module